MCEGEEKLKFILEKIDDLLSYKEEFGTIENLLNSNIGFDATLMVLLQIGETLNKLKDTSYANLLPIKGAYDVRNFIAHDYEGVNKAIIEDIIRRLIPQLKQTIQDILSSCY
jgi:uncharacterized protein with HEPN domain